MMLLVAQWLRRASQEHKMYCPLPGGQWLESWLGRNWDVQYFLVKLEPELLIYVNCSMPSLNWKYIYILLFSPFILKHFRFLCNS